MYVDRRLDTGRFYADAHGSIAMQPIKVCPGVFGAAACNNVALLQPLPLHTLVATDAFGRSVAMLAAMFNSWAVLQHLLRLPGGIDWSALQNTQVTRSSFWRFSPPTLLGAHSCAAASKTAGSCAMYHEHWYVQGPLNTAGRSALHYLCHHPPTAATAQQHAETISMLPDTIPAHILDAEDDHRRTPLLLAVRSRNLAVVEWLLAQGVDPDDNINVEESSLWPVIEAVKLRSAQIFIRLLNCGATVHCRDEYGRTPVSHALDLQHAEHLRLLVMYGADLDEHKVSSTVYEHIRFTPSHNHDQPMRQFIKELPLRSAGAALRAAVAQGLAARRHLVVLILGTRVPCSLSQDVMQLICQYASLMP